MRDWWKLYGNPDDPEDPRFKEYPRMKFVVASLDPAYTEKQENDYSGLAIIGVYKNENLQYRMMLMYAAHWRLGINPLVEKTAEICKRFRVDKLLIENKASGISVSQEMARLFGGERWGVQLVDPKGQDKVSRAYSVQHLWEQGLIYAPDKEWVELAVSELESLPKGRYDDVADATISCVKWLRDSGWALRNEERENILEVTLGPQGPQEALYDV